jgi:hypothetical protein|tara:strand:+ start:180 stop:311 length:132 start_codon:yes stop_codon:yes gene_type:complete
MIKKISLIFFCYCLVVSCGKKGDPEYKEPKKKAKFETVLINKV